MADVNLDYKILMEHLLQLNLIGEVKQYAGSNIPSGWLLCDGRAVSRTTYSALFSVIGTIYGAGDGSTTFNLPDCRGRVVIGSGTGTASDATTHALGSNGGEEKHQLTVAEMPQHTHTQNAHRHALSRNYSDGSGGGVSAYVYESHRKSSTKYTSYETATNQNTGGNETHNNMQPFTTMNFIIYAGLD